MAVCVLGAAGEEFGLTVVRGLSAAGDLLGINKGIQVDSSKLDLMSLSIGKYKRIPDELRRFYKRAGVRPSPGAEVPLFFVKPPYQVAREPNIEEVELLLYLVNCIPKAVDRGILRERETILPGGLLTLKLSGDPNSPEIAIEGDSTEPTEEERTTPALLVDRPALKRLIMLDEAWIVTCQKMPIRIKDIADEIRVLLLINDQTGMILDAQTVKGVEAIIQSARHLVDLMLGKTKGSAFSGKHTTGRPRKIVFTDPELYEVLGAVLHDVGIEGELVHEIPPMMQEALEGLVEHMGR